MPMHEWESQPAGDGMAESTGLDNLKVLELRLARLTQYVADERRAATFFERVTAAAAQIDPGPKRRPMRIFPDGSPRFRIDYPQIICDPVAGEDQRYAVRLSNLMPTSRPLLLVPALDVLSVDNLDDPVLDIDVHEDETEAGYIQRFYRDEIAILSERNSNLSPHLQDMLYPTADSSRDLLKRSIEEQRQYVSWLGRAAKTLGISPVFAAVDVVWTPENCSN